MPLIKYVANVNSTDGTGALRLKPDENGVERVLTRGGPALEVSEEELASLGGHYRLEEVNEGESVQAGNQDQVGDTRVLGVSPPIVLSPNPSTPSITEPPAQGGAEEH